MTKCENRQRLEIGFTTSILVLITAMQVFARPLNAQDEGWTDTIIFHSCDANNVETCRTFFHGSITAASADQLRAILDEGEGGRIFFNSPGGSLSAALEIGRMLRERGLVSGIGLPWIGMFGASPRNRDFEEWELEIPSATVPVCYSSCVYAFLGGIGRDIEPGAKIGIHQFSNREGAMPGEGGLMFGQIQASQIIAFLDSMGVPTQLFVASTETPSNELYFLTEDEAGSLGVISSGGFGPFMLVSEENNVVAKSVSSGGAFALDWMREVSIVCSQGELIAKVALENDLGFTEGYVSLSVLSKEQLSPSSVAEHSWGPYITDRSDVIGASAIDLNVSEGRGLHILSMQINPDEIIAFSEVGWFEIFLDAGWAMSNGGWQSAAFELSDVERVALHAVTQKCF